MSMSQMILEHVMSSLCSTTLEWMVELPSKRSPIWKESRDDYFTFSFPGNLEGQVIPPKNIRNQQEAVFNQVAGKARKSLASALSFSNRVIISTVIKHPKSILSYCFMMFHDLHPRNLLCKHLGHGEFQWHCHSPFDFRSWWLVGPWRLSIRRGFNIRPGGTLHPVLESTTKPRFKNCTSLGSYTQILSDSA